MLVILLLSGYNNTLYKNKRSPIISTPIFKLVSFANSVMIETVSVVTGPYANVKQRSLS